MNNIKTKRCTQCGTEHTGTIEELSEFFPWNNKSKKVLSSLCKTCNRERTKNYRNANKDRYNAISREWREKNKSYTKELYNSRKDIIKVIEGKFTDIDDDKLLSLEELLVERLEDVRKEILKRFNK